MRGVINRHCPPLESVLQAAELEMIQVLSDAQRAHAAGDTAAEARHLARLHTLAAQAAELIGRAA